MPKYHKKRKTNKSKSAQTIKIQWNNHAIMLYQDVAYMWTRADPGIYVGGSWILSKNLSLDVKNNEVTTNFFCLNVIDHWIFLSFIFKFESTIKHNKYNK